MLDELAREVHHQKYGVCHLYFIEKIIHYNFEATKQTDMKLNRTQTLILLIVSILANIAYRIYSQDWRLFGNSFFIGFSHGFIVALLIINLRKFFKNENTDISEL